MKPLMSRFPMRWMARLRLPLHRRYTVCEYGGFVCLMLSVLLSILIQDIGSDSTGNLIKLAASVPFIALLFASGTFFYITGTLWLPLLIFGALDILMAFAVGWELSNALFFGAAGLILTALGIFLIPRQKRMRAEFSKEAEAALLLHAARQTDGRVNSPESAHPPHASEQTAPAAPARRSFLQIRCELAELQRSAADTPSSADAGQLSALKEELGHALLALPELYVLCVDLGAAHPLYISTAGYFELFTDIRPAEIGQQKLSEIFGISLIIRRCTGTSEIHTFFSQCARDGHQHFRLDNGSRESCELNLSDFFLYRAEHLPDEKNRTLRHLLEGARLHEHIARSLSRESPAFVPIQEARLTMQHNALRLLGQGIFYVLGCAMPEDTIYATRAALEKLGQWKKEFPEELPFAEEYTVFTEKLNMHYVIRPGEANNPQNGALCLFTELAQARAAQQRFRESGMDCCVLLATWDHIYLQAKECAGVVVDMQRVNYEISASGYAQINTLRMFDAPIVVRLKDERRTESEAASAVKASSAQKSPSPKNTGDAAPGQCALLRDTRILGGWKQFSFQWPHRYGWDYMVRSAQYLSQNDLMLKTLVTAHTIAGNETDHIAGLPACGYDICKCLQIEHAVLAAGGFSKAGECLLKIYWFNQTDVVRIFTAGDVPEEKIQRLTDLLLSAGNHGF